MLRLVTIDLSGADVAAFETYETGVLALLGKHGGRLERRMRTLDGAQEIQILRFPDERAYEAFRDDPDRTAARPIWNASGASLSVVLVEDFGG